MTRPQHRSQAQDRSLIDAGASRCAQLTNDIAVASNILSVTAETVSFSAGAAGTTGVVAVDKAPICDAIGAGLGSSADTSFAWVTGTILTAEVAFSVAMESQSQATILAALTNGQYVIDYVLGKIYYCKATTGTSDTCNYTTRQVNMEITGVTSSVATNINVANIGGNAVTAGAGGVAAGTPRMTLASDDPAVASLAVLDDWDNAASDGASVSGDVAHDSPDAGEPIKLGGKAASTEPAAVTAADRVNAYFDLNGRLHVVARGYDTGSDALKIFDVAPEWAHTAMETTVLTNVANASPAFVYIDMDGYTSVSVHVEKTGGADTFDTDYESSNEGALSSDDWLDTTAVWTMQSGSATTDHLATPPAALRVAAHRVEITTAGAANDADFNIFVYKW